MTDIIKRAWMDGDRIIWHEWQDVEDLIEENHALRSEQQDCDYMRLTSRVPLTVYNQWFYEEVARGNTTLKPFGEEMDRIVERHLADRDWYKLRTDR